MKKFLMTLSASLLLTPMWLHAATYSFTQGGYAEGATVSVTLTGSDLDSSGQIDTSEVTAFDMSFSGNSLVSAFTLSLGDLWGLVYDDNGGPLGDGLTGSIEGIGASGAAFSYEVGPGPQSECGIGVDCAFVTDGNGIDNSNQLLVLGVTQAPLTPTSIPTLSEWGMIILSSLLALGTILTLRRKPQ